MSFAAPYFLCDCQDAMHQPPSWLLMASTTLGADSFPVASQSLSLREKHGRGERGGFTLALRFSRSVPSLRLDPVSNRDESDSGRLSKLLIGGGSGYKPPSDRGCHWDSETLSLYKITFSHILPLYSRPDTKIPSLTYT